MSDAARIDELKQEVQCLIDDFRELLTDFTSADQPELLRRLNQVEYKLNA